MNLRKCLECDPGRDRWTMRNVVGDDLSLATDVSAQLIMCSAYYYSLITGELPRSILYKVVLSCHVSNSLVANIRVRQADVVGRLKLYC